MKRFIAVVALAIVGLGSVFAEGAKEKPLDQVELRIMQRGPAPNQMREVLDEIELRLKDTLNVKISMDWIPIPDQKSKIQLALAAGENWAAFFDAPFVNYADAVSKKLYLPLDKYFLNDAYPGLKKEFPKPVVDNMREDDGHNYAIPLMRGFATVRYVLIRKDLRLKYGLPEIKDQAGLEQFFDLVLKNEKGMIPYGTNNYGIFSNVLLDRPWYLAHKNRVTDSWVFVQSMPTPILISEDGKRALQVYFPGDDMDTYNQFPKEWQDNFLHLQKTASRWYQKGYISQDIFNIKNFGPDFLAGKYAAGEGDNPNYFGDDQLKANVPGASTEIVIINEKRTFAPGTSETNYRSGNMIVIPSTTKTADRMMMFMDWLFASPDNHDLLELGIEGKHWTKVGEKQYQNIAGSTYNFPPYRMTWSANLSRAKAGMPDSYYKVDAYTTDPASTYLSPIKGFTFDSVPVKSEMAKVQPLYNDQGRPILLGLSQDPEGEYKILNKKAKELGLEKIRSELLRQITEYLGKR